MREGVSGRCKTDLTRQDFGEQLGYLVLGLEVNLENGKERCSCEN